MNNVTKKGLQTRLNRIEGQVRGLSKMLEENKYCIDIITQSQAIKSALSSFESVMLKNHLESHVAHQITTGKSKKAFEEILKIHNIAKK